MYNDGMFHEIHMNFKVSDSSASYRLYKFLLNYVRESSEIIILCIGTDRCTGDSLGPLVGTYLTSRYINRLHIYGTVEDPVHARNLEETLAIIHQKHEKPFIIAVDAALSSLEKVNSIDVGVGSLTPGAALNKDLNPVGDLYIKGIVNIGGFLDLAVLQSTRLANVLNIAKTIGKAIHFLDVNLSKNDNKKHLKQVGSK
ncbi:spore protease YyaC [Bacillaceae bacterium W0354]